MDFKRLYDLSGKTAVVLGAASGIGHGSAEALAGLGARVLCADSDAEGVVAVARGIGGEALTIDASRPDDVERLAEEATRRLGRIDVAVTTPGINIRKPLVEYTDEDFDRTYALNVRGTFFFLRAFARRTIAQGGNASLIACSSIRAETLEPGLTVYASTKSAITQLVRGAAAELGRYNIRVNAIAPSIIETALTAPIKARP
ncbi:MAG: SDR family oxidoreductase, partial [Candidatus Eremiobacteraeota bacterium]|nr:SDR family oxidoreductase [Candidatus Eremiobacteraeota bacterium]